MRRRFWSASALAIALVLGIGDPVPADAPPAKPTPQPTADPKVEAEATAPVPRGLQLFIDAETGELRPPTAKEAAMLAAQRRQMFGNKRFEPRVFNYKDGTTAIEVDPSLMKFSAARIEADGSLKMGCIEGPQRTLEFIAATSIAGAAEE